MIIIIILYLKRVTQLVTTNPPWGPQKWNKLKVQIWHNNHDNIQLYTEITKKQLIVHNKDCK